VAAVVDGGTGGLGSRTVEQGGHEVCEAALLLPARNAFLLACSCGASDPLFCVPGATPPVCRARSAPQPGHGLHRAGSLPVQVRAKLLLYRVLHR